MRRKIRNSWSEQVPSPAPLASCPPLMPHLCCQFADFSLRDLRDSIRRSGESLTSAQVQDVLARSQYGGWLTKKGHIVRNWKQRYFTLGDGKLR
jgi:hypothetical protein